MKKCSGALIQNMNKVVDMVEMVGWPQDVSLDVDLDVEKNKCSEKNILGFGTIF